LNFERLTRLRGLLAPLQLPLLFQSQLLLFILEVVLAGGRTFRLSGARTEPAAARRAPLPPLVQEEVSLFLVDFSQVVPVTGTKLRLQ
jgi:hypothetical protein